MSKQPEVLSDLPKLPQYQSHKVVRAARIRSTKMVGEMAWRLMLSELHESPVRVQVNQEWIVRRCNGRAPEEGYFVVYEDGYTSWSPAAAFEEGYSLVDTVQEPSGSGGHIGYGGTG